MLVIQILIPVTSVEVWVKSVGWVSKFNSIEFLILGFSFFWEVDFYSSSFKNNRNVHMENELRDKTGQNKLQIKSKFF